MVEKAEDGAKIIRFPGVPAAPESASEPTTAAPVPTPGPHRDDVSADLLGRYVSGDKEAFNELFAREGKRLAGFVLRCLYYEEPWIRDRSEEVYFQVWMEILKSAPSFQRRSSFWTWARRIASRRSKDQKKAWLKLREIQAPASEEKSSLWRRTAPTPEEKPDRAPPLVKQVEAREFARDLEAALNALPAEERRVFALREEEGLGWAEIVATLKAPRATLQDRLAKTVAFLRRRLSRHAPKTA